LESPEEVLPNGPFPARQLRPVALSPDDVSGVAETVTPPEKLSQIAARLSRIGIPVHGLSRQIHGHLMPPQVFQDPGGPAHNSPLPGRDHRPDRKPRLRVAPFQIEKVSPPPDVDRVHEGV